MSVSVNWWCVFLGHAWEIVATFPRNMWICNRCGKMHE